MHRSPKLVDVGMYEGHSQSAEMKGILYRILSLFFEVSVRGSVKVATVVKRNICVASLSE